MTLKKRDRRLLRIREGVQRAAIMPHNRGSTMRKFSGDKVSVYDEVTQRIVEALERGVVPWVRPWNDAKCGDASIPHNAATGRPYSGVNVLLLWMFGPPGAPAYITYKQAEALKAQVRGGEKGYRVVYADSHVKRETQPDGTEAIVNAYSFLKRYTVFHISQVDNLPDRFKDIGQPLQPLPDAEFRAFVERTGAKVAFGSNTPCYYPAEDGISMPPWPAFHTVSEYKAALLHELIHWTGAKHRLNRELVTQRTSPKYQREELVAEIGSAFLCAHLGVVGKVQHAEYLSHWLGLLKADSREIFRVSAAAQRAADYLLKLAGANQLQAAE